MPSAAPVKPSAVSDRVTRRREVPRPAPSVAAPSFRAPAIRAPTRVTASNALVSRSAAAALLVPFKAAPPQPGGALAPGTQGGALLVVTPPAVPPR
jgi:hypothetical protein